MAEDRDVDAHVIVEPERLDGLVLRTFAAIETRAAARKACKRGLILLDGELCKSRWFGRPGQLLSFHPDRRLHPPNTLEPEVVWQDEHLAVVVKPAGVLTNGNRHRTLERGLPNVLPLIELYPPHPVHRLDFETAGLVVCGRTPSAMRALSAMFEARRFQKQYAAIVVGRLEGEGVVTEPLDDRTAETRWRAVRFNRSLKVDWCTELVVSPVTGRMHQIRRHLAGLGHSVLGCAKYPCGPVFLNNGLFLAAVGLRFEHPFTGETLDLTTSAPAKFTSFQRREDRRWNRWHGRDTVRAEDEDVEDR